MDTHDERADNDDIGANTDNDESASSVAATDAKIAEDKTFLTVETPEGRLGYHDLSSKNLVAGVLKVFGDDAKPFLRHLEVDEPEAAGAASG